MSTEKSTQQDQQKKVMITTFSVNDFGMQTLEKRASKESFSTCVRVHAQNTRQGTVACKGRSDVAYSNRKPWKQKGTGRARAGSARSPLWRGGGVIFGPQERTRVLTVSKETKKQVMRTIFFDLLNNQRVLCADWSLAGDVPKTAYAYDFLKSAHLTNKRLAFFVSSDDVITQASFANINGVELFCFDQSNVYDLVRNHYWLVLKKDLNYFEKMVSQWT
jgi:large subunit ribosomal protein L4